MKNIIILINGWKIDNEDVLRAKYFHYTYFSLLWVWVCVSACKHWPNGGKWLSDLKFFIYSFALLPIRFIRKAEVFMKWKYATINSISIEYFFLCYFTIANHDTVPLFIWLFDRRRWRKRNNRCFLHPFSFFNHLQFLTDSA